MLTRLVSAAVVVVALIAGAAQAATFTITDTDLEMIAGENNALGSPSALIDIKVEANAGDANPVNTSGNNNIQLGAFQWQDNHANDVSRCKGATCVDSAKNCFQCDVIAKNNAGMWGALGQSTLTTGGDLGQGAKTASHATFLIGGF